jgi:AcrR family transcriptional regulator
MTLDAAPGLRERKRLATHRAIQLAVLELVADRGLDKVTVDEISRVADVSPRTFFNYFETKEAALIGEGPTLPDSSDVERFIAAGPESLGLGLGRMLARSAEQSTSDHELTYRRRALLRDYPHLFALRMATMKTFEAELADVIARRFVADGAVATSVTIEGRAQLASLVAFATMRYAWANWADEEDLEALGARIQAAFTEVEHLFASA